MSAKQLRLLPHAKPLTERFGAAFFLALPKTPGVYRMFDGRGRLVYVGKSGNLRQRVGSYRHVHPDRSSRKLIRLVHAVERIEIEECTSEEAARLRENSLLREHRPRFNSLNVWPKAHCFIGARCSVERWEFSFTRQLPDSSEGFYGAFKSGCLPGLASLLRLLWTALHRTTAPHDYPRALLGDRPPKEFVFQLHGQPLPPSWPDLLEQFFSGHSFALGDALKATIPPPENLSLFHQNFLLDDLTRLESFFKRGPARNAELRRKNALAEPLIGQERLDDLLVLNNPPLS